MGSKRNPNKAEISASASMRSVKSKRTKEHGKLENIALKYTPKTVIFKAISREKKRKPEVHKNKRAKCLSLKADLEPAALFADCTTSV